MRWRRTASGLDPKEETKMQAFNVIIFGRPQVVRCAQPVLREVA